MWDHTIHVQPLQAREVPVPLWWERTILLLQILVRALVLPLVHFGQSKPEGHTGLDTADSDFMHHQFRLSLLQWNPGPGAQTTYQHCFRSVWEVPLSYSTGRQ